MPDFFLSILKSQKFRLNGTASINLNDPLLCEYQDAENIVGIEITNLFINCPGYIHQYMKVRPSEYAPRPGCPTSVPDWKKLPEVKDVLPLNRHKILNSFSLISNS